MQKTINIRIPEELLKDPARGLFTVTLSNGHWAYGSQLKQKE